MQPIKELSSVAGRSAIRAVNILKLANKLRHKLNTVVKQHNMGNIMTKISISVSEHSPDFSKLAINLAQVTMQ